MRGGRALQPDLVVVGFYWNDLVGNEPPLPDPATTPRVTKDPGVYEKPGGNFIPKPIRDPLRQSLVIYLGVQAVKTAWDLTRPAQNEFEIVQDALLSGDQARLHAYRE